MNPRRWIALALFAVALVAGLARSARETPAGGRDQAPRPAPAGARDLSADEAAGGHTLRRHVGRSDEELRRRLADEPGISAASSFPDRATAERVVAAALSDGAARLERWLAGRGGNLTLDYRGAPGETIGRTLSRGAREPRPTGAARVVLRKRGGGFFVLTAYPVEPE